MRFARKPAPRLPKMGFSRIFRGGFSGGRNPRRLSYSLTFVT